MRSALVAVWALTCWFASLALAQTPPEPAVAGDAPLVVLLRLQGAIGPAGAEYVERGLQRAAQQHASLVVLQLDTPGGLDTAMRDIIKSILSSPVPVAAYVAPQGARAASAGTYIVYASHVAAMAPATTLATPVAIGVGGQGGEAPPAPRAASAAENTAAGGHDTMEAKRVSDATAYIRSLALLRGRNAEWAERAVREAVSLPASEALAQKVVDVVAADVPDLLRQLHGRKVHDRSGAAQVLATADARIEAFDPDWRARLLAVIGEPSLALLLMMIGFYGLLFEFTNPGYVAPGVIGAVCLLVGLFGLQTLPLNFAGLALMLLGMAFFIAEAFVPSYGTLGLGGVAAFTLGAVMLIDSDAGAFGLPRSLIYGLALGSLAFVLALAALAERTRRRPVVSGSSTLLGAVGEVTEASGAQGWAQVNGEHWRVRGPGPLRAGERIRVRGVDGLTLDVEET